MVITYVKRAITALLLFSLITCSFLAFPSTTQAKVNTDNLVLGFDQMNKTGTATLQGNVSTYYTSRGQLKIRVKKPTGALSFQLALSNKTHTIVQFLSVLNEAVIDVPTNVPEGVYQVSFLITSFGYPGIDIDRPVSAKTIEIRHKYVPPKPVVHPSGVLLNRSSYSFNKGQSMQLSATVLPSNATNKSVTWKSSKPSVATVDSTGKVKAIGNGTARITVTTNNGKTASCKVTVK